MSPVDRPMKSRLSVAHSRLKKGLVGSEAMSHVSPLI